MSHFWDPFNLSWHLGETPSMTSFISGEAGRELEQGRGGTRNDFGLLKHTSLD